MTYVRETCGCCGEFWPPRGGAAGTLVSLERSHPGVGAICLAHALCLVHLAVGFGRVSQA